MRTHTSLRSPQTSLFATHCSKLQALTARMHSTKGRLKCMPRHHADCTTAVAYDMAHCFTARGTETQGCISLGDIRSAPTRWVLALFLVFMNFWSNVPKFRPVGGGLCVYFLKSVRKGRFRNVWVGGGGGMITFLSKWSCKVDDAQDRAMLEGPLIILKASGSTHCMARRADHQQGSDALSGYAADWRH